MHPRLRHIALLLGVLLCGSQAFPQLSRVYVDVTNGSDSYTGANPTNTPAGSGPKASIHAGLNSVAGGGTIVLFAGTYPGDGVDTDGSPTSATDNADIEISSAKYPNLATGLTIEFRSLGNATEIRIQVDDNSVMAPNGALITHQADAYVPNFVVNLPGAVAKITRTSSAEFLNLIAQHSSGAPISGIILKAGSLDIPDSSLVRMKNGATITRYDTAAFANKAPSRGTHLSLAYLGGGNFTAGPEARYRSYGAGFLTVNKTAGTTVTFPSTMAFSGTVVPSAGNVTMVPDNAITISSGSAVFQDTVALGIVGSASQTSAEADISLNGTGSATFNGPVHLVVGAGAPYADNAISSVENIGSGVATFNNAVVWNAAWNAAGSQLASLTFGSGSGTALVRNASTGTIRFASTVTLSASSVAAAAGDAYFSVVVENDSAGTLSFDSGVSAPNTVGPTSGNRNFTINVVNASSGLLNISGMIRGNLSNTGSGPGTININGPTTVGLRMTNASGKRITLGGNFLTLTHVAAPPFLNDGAGGLVTPSLVNHITNGGTISGTLILNHQSGSSTFNGGTFGTVRCEGGGGTTQFINNGSTFDNVTLSLGTLNIVASTTIASALSITDGLLTISDYVTVQTGSYTQSGGVCLIGGGISGSVKILGDFVRTAGTFTTGTGSLIEIAGSRPQSVNPGTLFQGYDISFNNPLGAISLIQSVRASHSITLTPGTSLNLSTGDLILNGDNSTFTNGGSVQSGGGAIVFGGATTTPGGKGISGAILNSAGTGIVPILRVDVGVGNRMRSNGSVRFTQLLDLRTGTMEIQSGDLSASGSAARILHDMSGAADLVVSGGTFGGAGSAYDLDYAGSLSLTIGPGIDFTSNVRTWTININSDPNLDGDSLLTTGTIYYLQVPRQTTYSFGGNLFVGPRAAVRIAPGSQKATFVLSASSATHTVRGIFGTSNPDDAISVTGSGVAIVGSISTAEPALLGSTIVSSVGDCSIRNIHGIIGNLTTGPGSVVTLLMGSSTTIPSKLASEQIISGSLSINGTGLILASNLEVQNGIAFNAGLFNFGQFNVNVTTNGDYLQSVFAAGYGSSSGYLVLNRANASLAIGNSNTTALPNLRVLANISLTAPGRVNGNLEIGTPASSGIPTLRLGAPGNDLTLAGSSVVLSSDGTGNRSAVVSDGTSNGTIGGKLIIVSTSSAIIANSDYSIEELVYNPTGGAGTLNFVSTTGSPRIFTIADIFTHVSGDVNIGSNHLVLLGTGGGAATCSYIRTGGTILATTGEMRFEGLAAQQFTPGQNLTIPNMKVNNALGLLSNQAYQPFTVSGTLDLTRGALATNPGTLILGDGALIIRRGTGAFLASLPAFGNSVSISYLLDSTNGSLTTGSELPTGNTVLKTLRVNNPNRTPSLSGVFLNRSLTVRDTLFLDAGFLSKGSSELTVGPGGTIQMGGGSFDTTGTLRGAPLVSSYNLVYRTGTTFTSTDREFSSGGSGVVANLVVLSASNGTPTTLALHASRTIKNVTINSDGGGLALGPAGSLTSNTLSITGNLSVTAGAFLSSTGITSRIDLVGTTLQTITVPASGLVLPGGLSSINLRLDNPGGFLLQGGDLSVGQDAVLFFVNGVLRTGQNSVVLTQTSGGQGFDRSAVVPPQLSHVQGKVRHQIVGGAGSPTVHPNGRYEFPVGSATKYRPFAITFGGSYPAINSSTIDVEHQDGTPTGTAGFPIDGGSGVRIGNYSAFSWVVTVGANAIAPNQRYDLELQVPDVRSLRVQDLRLVQRLETSPANPWTLQGTGSSYYGNDLTVTSSGDSIARLRCAFTAGTLTAQGTRFAVGVPARPPVFLITLRDTTIAENQRLDFRYLSDPMDFGETIAYTLINPPAGAAVDQSSGSFVWRPSFGQAGSYSIVVTAFDGQFLTIASATVTVRRVNRPPAFTSVLRDTTIRETRDTLRFTYTAADPESDVLIYQLLSGPPGLTVTNSGFLQWVATAQQINKSYVVKVAVTDGLAGDTTSASIFVTRNRVRGDVDGDGLITANDASIVLKHVVGLIVLADPAALFAADASRDGTITAYDASLILQAAVGLIVLPTFSVRDVSSVKESVPSLSAVASTATLDWSTICVGNGSSECRLSLRLVSGKSDVYAVQWQIQGDFVRHPVKGIVPSLPDGWQLVYKQTDRELNIAVVGAKPISGRELATLTMSMTLEVDHVALSGSGFINETPQTLSQLNIAAVPSAFALEQNYPNPFNPSTTIRYLIPERCQASLVIYNMQGQSIRTLVHAAAEPGAYTVSWDGRNDRGDLVSSGIYVYRLNAGSFISNQRMILIR